MLSRHGCQPRKRRLCFRRKTPVFPPKDACVSTERRLCFYRKTPVFLLKDACVFLQRRASFFGAVFERGEFIALVGGIITGKLSSCHPQNRRVWNCRILHLP